ncbi:sodium/nucleoside cotransporter 2-like [Diadema antillarum]|uniref:sodium/nucleoside cotransporter 2-like n=1 Tax=Diadema antillarum TaxID=105358 RepID=UPI003A84AABD
MQARVSKRQFPRGKTKNQRLFINENLLPATRQLLAKANVERKKADYKYLWTSNARILKIYHVTRKAKSFLKTNKIAAKGVLTCLVLGLYIVYLIFACLRDFDKASALLIITCLAVVAYAYRLIRDRFGDLLYKRCVQPACAVTQHRFVKRFVMVLASLGFVVVLYLLTRDRPIQLVSLSGLLILVTIIYISSHRPHKVKWRPVLWGLVLQFLMGLFVLRTPPGLALFKWLKDIIIQVYGFSHAGAVFVFGEDYVRHYFAFGVLPILFYFGSIVKILYYYGVMQVIIQKMAWLMQRTMKTTAVESLSAAGNIFLGTSESIICVEPYLNQMTSSEIHAVMTGSMATVAGAVFGAYIHYGVDAGHLISASVMSAPAALAMAKLMYPETEKSKLVTQDDVKIPKGEERNVIEAAANGATLGLPVVFNVVANLIAFLSLLALVNAVLGYFGSLVGFSGLTLQWICSYAFMPLALVMGVEWGDCRVVAELIGLKTLLNELVAYEKMGHYIENRATGSGPTMSLRSEVIATYALCGFSNISSIGVVLGVLTPLLPKKRHLLAPLAVRALFAGSAACFTTACIAGVLYVPDETGGTTGWNETSTLAMTTL